MDRHNVRSDVTKKHHVFRFAKNTFSLSPPQRSANNVESCAKNLEMTSTGAGKKDKQRSMIRKRSSSSCREILFTAAAVTYQLSAD